MYYNPFSYSSSYAYIMVYVFAVIIFLIGMLILFAAIAAAYVGMWFTFKKMGQPGWKGIIPYYSHYVLYTTLWEKKQFIRFIIFIAGAYVASFVGDIAGNIGSMIAVWGATIFSYSRNPRDQGIAAMIVGGIILLIGLAVALAGLVFAVLSVIQHFRLMSRLSDAFGLKKAWAWGLTFMAPVMLLILGLHKGIVYRGAPDMQEAAPTPENPQ